MCPETLQNEPLATLSIVSNGDGERLSISLESIARHEDIAKLRLIVTDNLGTDLPEISDTGWHSLVLLRRHRPQGFARNHNEAFLNAQGKYFCVLNPDVIFQEKILDGLIRHVQAGEGDIAAPMAIDSKGNVQDSFRPLPSPWDLVKRRLGQWRTVPMPAMGEALRPDWIAGIFMLMRRVTFQQLGGFDARFRLYFEDVDFCTRARLLGMTILVDGTRRVTHDPRHASRRPGRYQLWHAGSALRFFGSPVYWKARRMKHA